MEKVPVNKIESEDEKKFSERLEDLFARVKTTTIDLLIREHPDLDYTQVENYLNSASKKFIQETKELMLTGALSSLVTVPDFETLALVEYEDHKVVQELGLEINNTNKEHERRYGISFGGHEELFTEENVFNIKADFLRNALKDGFENVLAKERVAVAKHMAKIYAYHGKEIPSKLKLLVSQEDINEISAEVEKDKRSAAEGPSERVKAAIKTRVLLDSMETEVKREEMVEKGIHPKMIERREHVDLGRKSDFLNNSIDSLSEDMQTEMQQIENIVSSYDDPRDFYDHIVDVSEARKLFKN